MLSQSHEFASSELIKSVIILTGINPQLPYYYYSVAEPDQ